MSVGKAGKVKGKRAYYIGGRVGGRVGGRG
jgi:hypothetical protein